MNFLLRSSKCKNTAVSLALNMNNCRNQWSYLSDPKDGKRWTEMSYSIGKVFNEFDDVAELISAYQLCSINIIYWMENDHLRPHPPTPEWKIPFILFFFFLKPPLTLLGDLIHDAFNLIKTLLTSYLNSTYVDTFLILY